MPHRGEALGNVDLWKQRTMQIMGTWLNHLPWLLDRYYEAKTNRAG